MGRQDFLDGHPARPTTIVPGQWVLDLPPSGQISVRCFRASRLPTEIKATGVEAALSKLRDDPLEKGWRVINGREGSPEGGGVKDVLRSACAILDSTPGQGGGKEEKEKVLWCFSALEEDFSALEGLEEFTLGSNVIDPVKLFRCTDHGHRYSCLKAGGNACELRWSPSAEVARQWELLGLAIVEKAAWWQGKRVSMRPGALAISCGLLPGISLRPMDQGRLVLSIQPGPRQRCRHPNPSEGPFHRPLVLQPANLPALALAPCTPTPIQEARLEDTFEVVLGAAWKDGRNERKIKARLHGEIYSDWTIYWVPTLPDETRSRRLDDLTAAELSSSWQEESGILTVWPSHWAVSLSADENDRAIRPLPCRAPPVLLEPTTTSEMMNTAFNIFDILSNYREPPPAKITPEADEDDPAVKDDPADVGGDLMDSGTRGSSPRDGSDFDDLFSAHSDSPGPPEKLDSEPIEEENPSHRSILPEPPLHSPEPPVYSPPRPVMTPVEAVYEDATVHDVAHMITEDDFDFFDSPNLDGPAETEPVVDNTEMAPDQMSPEEGRKVSDVQEADELELVNDAHEDHPAFTSGMKADPIDEDPIKMSPEPSVIELLDNAVINPSPVSPSIPAIAEVTGQRESQPKKKARLHSDLIPAGFEPIHLPPPTAWPIFMYNLPSPAPTPESLRPELMERLTKPVKTAEYDYAKEWGFLEEDSSASGVEDEYTGAPPTPESQVDETEPTTARATPGVGVDDRGEDEVEFGGSICVGAEWVSLKDERELMVEFEKNWNSGWPDGTSKLMPTPRPTISQPHPVSKDVLLTLDCDLLSRHIVENRHLRAILPPPPPLESPFERDCLPSMGDDGSTLAELTGPSTPLDIDERNVSAGVMTPCNVHVGFHHNVMSLPIAGLRYWRELGLQPVGGPKNVKAFVMFDERTGLGSLAREFLVRMSRAYQEARYGSHLAAGLAGSEIVPVTLSAVERALNEMSVDDGENVIIYFMVDRISDLADILLQICSSTMIADSKVVQLIPTSIMHQRDLSDLATEVYNRLPRLIRPAHQRGSSEQLVPTYIQHPSFTLVPDTPPRPSFSLSWPLRSYDVLNRWRYAHAAYTYSAKLGVLVAFIIDAEGEINGVKTFRTADEGWKEKVEMLWSFFRDFADTMVAIEWRISICAMGLMEVDEVDAWLDLADSKASPMTILMVDPSSSSSASSSSRSIRARPVFPNIAPNILNDTTTRILDDTLSAYSTSYTIRIPLTLPSDPGPTNAHTSINHIIYPKSTFLTSIANPTSPMEYITSTYHIISYRSAPGKEEEKIDEILAREFYRLTCLGRLRFGFEGGMGVHLEAVNSVVECLGSLVSGEWM